MTSERRNMRAKIEDFLSSKSLSANSQSAYRYDLGQFCDLVEEQVTVDKLQLYQTSLLQLKPTAQKRKLSAVNQFLFYLYQQGELTTYHRLELEVKLPKKDKPQFVLDLSSLWAETPHKEGQLIALLISQLGLLPSEILDLKGTDINPDFEIIRVSRQGNLRILPLPKPLLPYLEQSFGEVYLFDRGGQVFSRQWLSRQLKDYLTSLDLADLSAQGLREQFILQQVENGIGSLELAKHLGLKTSLTLEKYYKNGY